MPQALGDILNSLSGVYQPQADAVQNQINQLPQYYQAQQQGLNVAKDNAFGQITNQANDRGVLYSGAPIDAQNKYVGATYLPALAGLAKQQEGEKFNLQSQLNDIAQKKQGQAYDIYNTQIKNENDYAIAQQKLAQSRAGSAKAPSQQSQLNSLLSSAYEGYNPKDKSQQYYTEHVVIPQLVAQTGIGADSIAKQVYAYRKSVFGE